MAKTYIGTIETLSEKPWKDRDTGEDITLYSFQLEGSRQWFRTGTIKPDVAEGDSVKFVTNGQRVVIDETTKIEQVSASDVPKPEAAPSAGNAKSGGARAKAYSGNSRDDYWRNKDEYDKKIRQPMIAYQSARSCAVQIVTAALENDILALGQKKAAKLELLMGLVDEITGEFVVRYNEQEASLSD